MKARWSVSPHRAGYRRAMLCIVIAATQPASQERIEMYPRTFSHIGISVPDLDRAIDFYTAVLGWYVIRD